MKQAPVVLAVVLSLGMALASDADAKRLGGARSSGMQRQHATQPAPTTPQQPAAPSQAVPGAGAAAAAAPAAAAKRSWAGPLTGLAAGLGLAALASYLGFGQALANVATLVLIGMALLAVVGLVMRKRAAGRLSPAHAGTGAAAGGTGLLGGSAPARQPAADAVPGFDAAEFARIAKAQFIALQAANDEGDVQRLRDYLAPEVFDAVREEVQARGDAPQRTEVFGLDAQVLEAVQEQDRHLVSVRFTGSVRQQPGAVPEDLDEIWHLAKPHRSAGGWLVVGIQQAGSAH